MSVVETQYFALLRAALWGTPVIVDAPFEWDAVMKVAQHHNNDVLLSDVAARMTSGERPSQAILDKMQLSMRNGLLHQMRQRQILVSAVKLLREHDIEPVLLKGFGLALLYPNPSLRQFGDIDLFVGLDHFHEACSLLRTLPGGYNWGEEKDIGRHYNIEFGRYPMEVHRVSADIDDAKENALYEAIEREGLLQRQQHVDLDGFPITLPSKEFQVFFTFFHAWHHFLTTGVGWRQLTDVALALHAYHNQLDLEQLQRWLTSMRLMQPWQTFGWLMVDRLGLPETEMPFYNASTRRRAQKLYRQIMEEGNFLRANNFKRKKPKHRLWHKTHAFLSIFSDFFYRVKVFPAIAFREMGSAFRYALKKQKK